MRYLLSVFIVLLHFTCYSQKETINWFLFQNAIAVAPSGVTTGLPAPNYLQFNPLSSNTSVSDTAGHLLFACDGNKIIDRDLTVMPALVNHNFYAQYGSILAQKIPNSTKYYVFYTASNAVAVNSSWTLKYAIVDLSLNSGKGDVTIYDQVIDTALSAGFTLAQGTATMDAWLVTHRILTDSFFTYKITSAGISIIPVISKAGTYYSKADYIFKCLKTSFNGKMIAGVAYRDHSNYFASISRFIEVFNFDASTGTLSNKIRTTQVGYYFNTYQSVEFSPDNRLLYDGQMSRIYGLQPCGFGSGAVTQYNLCYTDTLEFTKFAPTVANDFQWCGPGVSWGIIQLGADKRIHMPYTGTMVSTINNPNRIGTSVNYVYDSYHLSSGNSGLVVTPGFHHKELEKAVKNNIVYNGACYPSPTQFNITNDTITSISWNFGDAASANNLSSQITPSHIFSSPGKYTVTAKLYNNLNRLIETVTELVEIKNPATRLLTGYPRDTVLCEGSSFKMQLNVVNGIFHWYQLDDSGNQYNSMIGDENTIGSTGTWYVEMRQNECNGCRMVDSIHLTILPRPYSNLGYDKVLCLGDSIQLSVYDTARYFWNTGDTSLSIWVKQGGIYWVEGEYNNNGCPFRDSIVITDVPGIPFSFPNDTTLCNNQNLLLAPGIANANYYWQDGSTNATYSVTQPGTYWATVTSTDYCVKSDTIRVTYINAQNVDLGNDTTLCSGNSVTLQSNVPNSAYLWNTGSTASQLIVNQTGTYWLHVTNGNCTVSDTIQVTFSSPPFLFLGNDTSLCTGEIQVLQPGILNATYTWQNSSSADSFIVTQPGKYWLQIEKNGCIVKDTIEINYYPVPIVNLGPDKQFCTGSSAVLNAGMGFAGYVWNTAATTQSVIVYNPGIYTVLAITSTGCQAFDTLQVLTPFPLPSVMLDHRTTICIGTTRLLDAGNNFTNYLWNNGSNSSTKTITGPGMYVVTVTDINGCKDTDTTIITTSLALPEKFLPSDTAVCSYETLSIAPAGLYTQYLWSTNATARTINIAKSGIYWLQVTDQNNCVGKDSIIVYPKDCMQGLYVPTAFTPNGDGNNDLFKPLLFGSIVSYSCTIYNRYGKIVFQSNEPGKGWDGYYKGVPQPTNSFIWTCTYQFGGQQLRYEKGTVTLFR